MKKTQVPSLTSKKKELEENFRAVGFAVLVASLKSFRDWAMVQDKDSEDEDAYCS